MGLICVYGCVLVDEFEKKRKKCIQPKMGQEKKKFWFGLGCTKPVLHSLWNQKVISGQHLKIFQMHHVDWKVFGYHLCLVWACFQMSQQNILQQIRFFVRLDQDMTSSVPHLDLVILHFKGENPRDL